MFQQAQEDLRTRALVSSIYFANLSTRVREPKSCGQTAPLDGLTRLEVICRGSPSFRLI